MSSISMTIPSEDNPTCNKCGLWKSCRTPFMKSNGAKVPKVLIIGEAPGEEEDRDGIPFVGRSGRLLREVLEEVGFDEEDIRFTNVVRCRPKDNKVSKRSINYCSEFAFNDIEEYNPDQVWLMGNSPLNGILGESGISNWNGVIIEKERTYVPLFHPAYILRNQDAMDEWLDAMLKAVDGKEKRESYEYIFPKTVQEVEEMARFLAKYEYISYDTETSDLNAFNKESFILSVSFAAGGKAFALPIDHPESWWSDEELDRVVYIVKDILWDHDGNVIGHNTKFDLMHTIAYLDCKFSIGGDTMLLSHIIDSRRGIHGLKRLAGIHLGMYEYEAELEDHIRQHPEADPDRGGSYAFIPLEILLPYGAMDAEATDLLHPILYDKLSDKQKVLYDQAILFVSDILAEMQCNGMVIDEYIAKRYELVYNAVQNEVYYDMLGDKKLQKMIKARQKELDEKTADYNDYNIEDGYIVFYGEYITRGKGKVSKNKKLYRKKRQIYQFNPNSPDQVAELFFDYYNIPLLGKTKTGKPSVKSKLMRPLEDEYPIIHKVRYYKLLNKMLSTYIRPSQANWLSDDGRVRTTFNQHGTITARLSSSDPFNSQNIPTPEKEPGTLLEILPIKNLITHSFINYDANDFVTMFRDGVVMSADYSGMELRVFASLAKCEKMLQIHRSGRDFHSMVAVMSLTQKEIADILDSEIKALPKPVRYVYKWTNWTLLFGGSAYTLHKLYNVPLAEAEETVEMYYRTFPEVLDFKDECVEFTEKHGYIESPFGRRIHLPDINSSDDKRRNHAIREAINAPVQSGAGETTLIAVAIVGAELKRRKFSYKDVKLVNTVHDSIVLDLHRDFIDPVAELCRDVMENIIGWAGEYMPGIDFSWLISPLKADIEIGSHYGSEMEISEWRKIFG